ncbi:hypothetical protein [Streptomyces sp. V3I7]|nr:hypothetical protein [Streptomyces sp. V3I7]
MDGDGAVHNEISGGTQYGPVLQAKSFSSITFTMGQATPPPGNIPNN